MWTPEKIEEAYNTKMATGLTSLMADIKFKEFGENCLTEKGGTPWYIMFLQECTNFFALLLWAGALLCFIGFGLDTTSKDNLYLGIVLVIVVICTACFSYYQRAKAANLMASFKNFIPREAMCKRDGSWKKIPSRLLVPGDIIQVKGGDNVPADIILYSANEMFVNNASLTGEAEELVRNVEDKNKNVFESKNVAFFGTMATKGIGEGIVFRTGDNTVIGRIASLAASAETVMTPLAHEIEKFTWLIAGIAITMGLIFFIFGFIYGYGVIPNLIFFIGIIVANVPEGLLATVTVCLALAAKRMAENFVLVKNLESVETLGSTTCICSDKTGTLT